MEKPSAVNEQVNLRLSQSMIRMVDKAIKEGYANSRSEFIRMAIVERLRSLGLLTND
jgi:Arc/MetJ-type ribon-helix-helix transcriptional regulator